MPNGQTMPVHIPAALGNNSASNAAAMPTVVVTKPQEMQGRTMPVSSVSTVTTISSTSASVKQVWGVLSDTHNYEIAACSMNRKLILCVSFTWEGQCKWDSKRHLDGKVVSQGSWQKPAETVTHSVYLVCPAEAQRDDTGRMPSSMSWTTPMLSRRRSTLLPVTWWTISQLTPRKVVSRCCRSSRWSLKGRPVTREEGTSWRGYSCRLQTPPHRKMRT